MGAPRLPPHLVGLTPGTVAARDVAALERAVALAFAAGLPGLLLREPELADRELLVLARALRARAAEHDAWFGVHDRLHVALAVDAHAVHLGFRSLAPQSARRALARADDADDRERALARAERTDLALGLSAHAGDAPGAWAHADYLVFGPVRATPKDPPLELVGFDALAQAAQRAAPTPLHAIGGLAPGDAGEVLAAGARGAFVLRGVLGAADPGAAVRAYLASFDAAASSLRPRGAAPR